MLCGRRGHPGWSRPALDSNLDSARDATVLRLPGPDYVLGIAWSDDGRSLVATSSQGYMRWEAADG